MFIIIFTFVLIGYLVMFRHNRANEWLSGSIIIIILSFVSIGLTNEVSAILTSQETPVGIVLSLTFVVLALLPIRYGVADMIKWKNGDRHLHDPIHQVRRNAEKVQDASMRLMG